MPLSGVPGPETAPPAIAVELAAGRPIRLVWVNELDGLTCQLGEGATREFVKWNPADSPIDLSAEARRLTWAATFSPVPRLLDQGADETGSWLLTAGLPGDSAVADRWKNDPATAVRAIGEGLRALHDALPVDECPFQWSAADRLADAQTRAAAGQMDPQDWHAVHHTLSVPQALELLADIPPCEAEQLVVCHGDSCAPNTLIGDDGRWSAHVDLGRLGVADRWADLAVATWSTTWNYGPGWEKPLLEAYGIDPDPDRIAYYRLLWDLG